MEILFCFSTKTHEEYLSDHLAPQTGQVSEGVPHEVAFNVTYPSSLDWRMKGFVTEVGVLKLHSR